MRTEKRPANHFQINWKARELQAVLDHKPTSGTESVPTPLERKMAELLLEIAKAIAE